MIHESSLDDFIQAAHTLTQRLWHRLIPYPEDRIPVTVYTIHNVFFPLLPLLLMSYLVRRPNTHLYRLALMPITIWAILRASFAYVWVDELYGPYNFGQGLFGMASVGKALEYGFVRRGRFKLGEVELGQVQTPAIDRLTENEPSTASTLGVSKARKDEMVKTGAISAHQYPDPVNGRVFRSPSGVTLQFMALPEGDTSPDGKHRKPIKSPSGVTLAFKDSTRPHTPQLKEGNGVAVFPNSKMVETHHPLQGLADAIEVVGSVRGIGWDWGKGLHVAPETRPLDRRGFILSTLSSTILAFLTLDFIESMLKVIPGFSPPGGGSIYFMDRPFSFLTHTFLGPWVKAHPYISTIITRYTVSTTITFFIGIAIIAGFSMCYGILTLFCVGLLGHNPQSWPPLFDSPWLTTSLGDFWGRRWHQTLRQTFFVFGGYPAEYVLKTLSRPLIGEKKAEYVGRIGLVLGTFTASGLFHGLSIYTMGKGGTDHTATVFFASQGVFVLLERVWKKVTGMRVDGIWGRIWAYSVVLFGIQYCMDGWTTRGLASGLIIPLSLSPTRLIIFPILLRILDH